MANDLVPHFAGTGTMGTHTGYANLKHISATVKEDDNIIYVYSSPPETHRQTYFGTITSITESNGGSRKRRSPDDDDGNYTFSVRRWNKVAALPFSKAEFKYAAATPVIEQSEEVDEISGNEIIDIAHVLHYKTFNDDLSYLWGLNNLYVTCDETYKGNLPSDTNDVTFTGLIFEFQQGIMLASQRVMWSRSLSQKNRKSIKMEGVSEKIWKYFHKKYWDLATDDDGKRQKLSTAPIRSLVVIHNPDFDQAPCRWVEGRKPLLVDQSEVNDPPSS